MSTPEHDIRYLLTAYADEALTPEGRAWVEAKLAADPELRERLEALRAVRAGLPALLPAAPAELDAARRARVLAHAAHRRRWAATPRWRVIVGLAAACLALVPALGLLFSNYEMHSVRESARIGYRSGGDKGQAAAMPEASAEDETPPVRIAKIDPQPKAVSTATPSDDIDGLKVQSSERPADEFAAHGQQQQVAELEKKERDLRNDKKPTTPYFLPYRNGGPPAPPPVAKPAPSSQAAQAMKDIDGKQAEERLEPAVADKKAKIDRTVVPKSELNVEAESDKPAPNTVLDLPVEDSQKEEDSETTVAKKRQDAVSESEVAGSGAFMALPANPNASGMFGSRSGGRRLPRATDDGRTGWVDGDRETERAQTSFRQLADAGKVEREPPRVIYFASPDPSPDAVAAIAPGEQLAKSRWATPPPPTTVAAVQPVGGIGYDPQAPAQPLVAANTLTIEDSAQSAMTRQASVSAPFLGAALGQPLTSGQTSDRGVMTELGFELPLTVDEPTLARVQPAKGKAPSNGLTKGEALVGIARRAHAQLTLGGGRAAFGDARAPLDPTDLQGLTPEQFRAAFGTSPLVATAVEPRQTFALDANTAAYNRARMQLRAGQMPDPATVQPEQFVNAMPMDYPPATGAEPFALYAEAAPSPFAAGPAAARTVIVAVGVVARTALPDERRPLHLTVAVDCSGSMAQPGGLARVQLGLRMLVANLRAEDQLSLVVFADQARLALPPTSGAERERIERAITDLAPGGSTNCAEGLTLAYQVAAEGAAAGAESRVLLATDGATLSGSGADQVLERIAAAKERGITLVVVGCGERAFQASELERLADRGDGQNLFLGSDDEARALFSGPLLPEHLSVLARDAKVQVTWNRERVSHARLIGYEHRRLRDRDFRDDRVDAGELQHDAQVTALFEAVLIDGATGPLGDVAVRCFDTRLQRVTEQPCPLSGGIVHAEPTPRLRLLACAAEFAELLQQGWWSNAKCSTWERLQSQLSRLPQSTAGVELRELAERAAALDPSLASDSSAPRGAP
jgi:Ca-activated chloride channel family protein